MENDCEVVARLELQQVGRCLAADFKALTRVNHLVRPALGVSCETTLPSWRVLKPGVTAASWLVQRRGDTICEG